MGVAVISRAFTQTQQQAGPALHRGAALGLIYGGHGGTEFGSETKPKPTAAGVRARFWLSLHQGRCGACSMHVCEAGGRATGSERLLAQSSRRHSPCAGIACSFPPRNIPSGSYSRGTSCETRTHTHAKEKDKAILVTRSDAELTWPPTGSVTLANSLTPLSFSLCKMQLETVTFLNGTDTGGIKVNASTVPGPEALLSTCYPQYLLADVTPFE